MQYEIFKEKFLKLWNNNNWGSLYYYDEKLGCFRDNLASYTIYTSPNGINSINSLINCAIQCVRREKDINKEKMSKREAIIYMFKKFGDSIEKEDYIKYAGKSYWGLLKEIYNMEFENETQYVTWWKVTFDDENANTWFSRYGLSDYYYYTRKYYNESGEFVG